MVFSSGSLSFNILAAILTILLGCYTYFKWCFKYWERKRIPYAKPRFPFGTLPAPIYRPATGFGEQCQIFYNHFKAKGERHFGIYLFATPAYVVVDIDLVKNIIQKDFNHFVDRGVYYNEKDDPLSAHLFSIEGAKWRNLRTKLTPTFTSGKMKMMFPILLECGKQLNEAMDTACNENKPIDIKDFAARFTTNVIGSCAFGIECNCFKEPNSEFIEKGKRVFAQKGLEALKLFIGWSNADLGNYLGIKIVPDEAAAFFMKTIEETINYRKNNNTSRKDFMQLLIDIKDSVKDENGIGVGLTNNELAAQAFIFFIAGYETSSSTKSFCLFELARNQDIQDKLREEVNKVLGRHDGEITYDSLMEMKYMEQVIEETLRMYPPLMFLNRKCVEKYKIPGTNIELEKDTQVIVPTLGIHRDPEYFPDPETFDPDRFSEENKSKIAPFTYLPFGEGPRICIGLRFGMMQTKVGLSVLLRNYKFSLNNKTKIPLKIDPLKLVMAVKGDLWLNVEKLK